MRINLSHHFVGISSALFVTACSASMGSDERLTSALNLVADHCESEADPSKREDCESLVAEGETRTDDQAQKCGLALSYCTETAANRSNAKDALEICIDAYRLCMRGAGSTPPTSEPNTSPAYCDIGHDFDFGSEFENIWASTFPDAPEAGRLRANQIRFVSAGRRDEFINLCHATALAQVGTPERSLDQVAIDFIRCAEQTRDKIADECPRAASPICNDTQDRVVVTRDVWRTEAKEQRARGVQQNGINPFTLSTNLANAVCVPRRGERAVATNAYLLPNGSISVGTAIDAACGQNESFLVTLDATQYSFGDIFGAEQHGYSVAGECIPSSECAAPQHLDGVAYTFSDERRMRDLTCVN